MLETLQELRREVDSRPTDIDAHARLLSLIRRLLLPREDIVQEHLLFGVRHGGDSFRPAAGVDRAASRPIAVGLLLDDAARFVEPLLREHDPNALKLTVYLLSSAAVDPFVLAPVGVDIVRLPLLDAVELADRIGEDRLDVLIDVGDHTNPVRLGALSRRCATIQATYLAHVDTSGLSNVDFRITDHFADPSELDDAHAIETLVRLSTSAWCFDLADAVSISEARLRTHPMAFGCFEDTEKLSDETLDVWTEILAIAEDARMVLTTSGAGLAETRQRVEKALAAHGVQSDRVDWRELMADQAARLSAWGEVDVALDPFPWGRADLAAEALSVGVPVVTLRGDRHSARVATSVVLAASHPEWVADDRNGYVACAVDLASDSNRRAQLRNDLRSSIGQSPLASAPRFARAFEGAVRAMLQPPLVSAPVSAERRRVSEAALRLSNQLLENGPKDRACAAALHATLADPFNAEAHNSLGNAWVSLGDELRAAASYERATACDPHFFKPLSNLGTLALKRGDPVRAIELLSRALSHNPEAFRAHANLGRALLATGDVDGAIVSLERSVALKPSLVALSHLSEALSARGRFADAAAVLRVAITLSPRNFELTLTLANALARSGHAKESEATFQRALDLMPDRATETKQLLKALCDAELFDLGWSLALRRGSTAPLPEAELLALADATERASSAAATEARLFDVARSRSAMAVAQLICDRRLARDDLPGFEGALREAMTIFPGDVRLTVRLALLLRERGRTEECEGLVREILAIEPSHLDAQRLLISIEGSDGLVDESLGLLADLAERAPDLAGVPELTAGLIGYSFKATAQEVFRAHTKVGARIERLAPRTSFPVRHQRPDKLRVGYVSADFREHSVARFIEPILVAHDRSRFEIFAYHVVRAHDRTTDRLRALDLRFVDAGGLDADQLSGRIVADGIDILVDLGGHSEHSRIDVFARRPSPVSVTYLGYAGSTGLRSVDYRITDGKADPPGSEEIHTETLVRLPESAWCFWASSDAPPVTPRPHGRVRFGSFNAATKINEEVLDVWARILLALPDASLTMKSSSFTRQRPRARYMAELECRGIDPHRVELLGWDSTTGGHLHRYAEVDVALDTFPYNGTTTTCEALWMGVPVVTLLGDRHAGRVGLSLLESVGLKDLVASSRDEYQRIALELAKNEARRVELRRDLRSRFGRSPLGDAGRFVANLEAAYEAMFENYLAGRTANLVRASRVWSTADEVKIVAPDSLEILAAYALEERSGYWEEQTPFLHAFLKPGMGVLDLGAGYGVLALTAAKLVGDTGTVRMIERSVEKCTSLAASVDANGFVCAHLSRCELRNDRAAEDELRGESDVEHKTLAECLTDDAHFDLVRLGFARGTAAILRNAERWIERAAPLIMLAGVPIDLHQADVFEALTDQGYAFHRWSSALGALVPLQKGESTIATVDSYSRSERPSRGMTTTTERCAREGGETVVAVPARRMRKLVEDGIAMGETPIAAVKARPSAVREWIAKWPYAVSLGWVERPAPLSLSWFVSAELTEEPAARRAALECAFAAALDAAQRSSSTARMLTLARVAQAVAKRDLACEVLRDLERSIAKATPILDEPFLCCLPRYQALQVANVASFVLGQIMEARHRWSYPSSFFAEVSEVGRLQRFDRLEIPDPSGAMQRRLATMKRRYGV